MKNSLLSLTCIISLSLTAQQVVPLVDAKKIVSARATQTKIITEKIGSQEVSKDTLSTIEEETGRENDKVFIMGIGGIDALSYDKLSIAGTFTAGFRIHPIWYSQVTFNYGTQISATRSADSVLLSELYFPDLSNSACSYSTELIIAKPWGKESNSQHTFLFGFDATLQNKQIEKDSIIYKVGAVNFTPGFKYRWIYRGRDDVQSSLVIGGYFNYVSINNSSSSTFNELYNNTTNQNDIIGREFIGISFIISYQIQNTIFYARSFTDIKRSDDLAFSVGIKQAMTFKSF
jgi:hypothetical protein